MKKPKSTSARAWSWVTANLCALTAISVAGGLTSCSTIDMLKHGNSGAAVRFQADVARAEDWARSPLGQALLNDLVTGVNTYVASTGGGAKSQANAAAIGAAVRSLETGNAPDVVAVGRAVVNYIPSGTSREVVNAIVASAVAGPNVNGSLEVVAKTIDATTSAASVAPRVKSAAANPGDSAGSSAGDGVINAGGAEGALNRV